MACLSGPHASAQQIATFKDKILATPHLYIAQPTLDLSVCPMLTDSGLSERHIDTSICAEFPLSYRNCTGVNSSKKALL